MKTKNSLVVIAACVAVATFAGCNKSNTPPPGGSETNPATATATDAAKDLAGKATDVAGSAAAAVTNLVSGATAQFADGVANAKKFIADKNYQGALDELKKLASLQLSDEQQKVVDGLKEQATKLLAGGAAGAVDSAKNLLGK